MLWDLALGLLEIVYLRRKSVPDQPVLNPLNFVNSCIRKSILKVLLDAFPLLRNELDEMDGEEIVSLLNFVNIFPVRRESYNCIICIFEEFCRYSWFCLQVTEPNKCQGRHVAIN